MEIKVDMQPVVVARLNMEGFKKELTSSFKIEKAVIDNLVINENHLVDKDKKIKQMIFQSIDWGQVMKMFHVKKQKEMNIYINRIEVDDRIQYAPDTVNELSASFTFEERRGGGKDFLVTHSFIPLLEHHIETYLASTILDYTKDTWKKV
jgi:hypothetical protein